MASVSEVVLYIWNWTIFLDLNVKEYFNSIPTLIKLVDGQNASSISLPVFGKKQSTNPMKKKVQLAINLGLKTLQIVRFALSNSSTLQHIVAAVYENSFIVLAYCTTFAR